MVTLSLPSTEFEHHKSKTIELTNICIASSAGNALGFVPIYEEVAKTIGQTPSEHNIRRIADITKLAYVGARNGRLEQEILATMGLSLQGFFQANRTLAPEILANLVQAMQQYNYGLSVVIAGVDESGCHIYRIDNPGRMDSYDTIGHCAIGSGELHAISTFIANDYDSKLDLNHVVAMTYEAKRRSEKSQGVGKETDLYVISQDSITKLPENTVAQLDEIYNKKTDQEKESVAKLEELVQRLNIDGVR